MNLYDQLGGEQGIGRLVGNFYARLSSDPALDTWFAHADHVRYRSHLRAYLAVSLGGPENYKGRDLRTAHRGMRITRAAFDTVIAHLAVALETLEVEPATARQVSKQLRSLRAIIVAPPES